MLSGKKTYRFGWLGGIIILFASCNINGTNWDVDVMAPVMETTLDFTKMVGQENLDVATDSALTLHIEDTIYRFELDTLSQLNLPDVSNTYTWNFGQVDVPPGTALPTQTFPIALLLNDIELVQTIIKQGDITLTVKSAIPRKLYFRYYIPAARLNGNQFEVNDSIEAAPVGDSITYTKVFDASGYDIDLRGANMTNVNVLDIFVEVTLDPNGTDYTLTPGAFLFRIDNTFDNVLPAYGKGYLGQFSFQSGNTQTELDLLNRIPSGSVDITNTTLDLQMINNIGADVRFRPYMVKAYNDRLGSTLSLTHPSLGNTININRATETGMVNNPVSPSIYSMNFTSGNSNLEQMVEMLPNRFELSADLFLNPNGNLGGYSDFYFYDYPAMIYMDLVAPLRFAVNDVWFVDTLDNFLFNEAQLDKVISGEIRVVAENKFPLETAMQIYTLDNTGMVTDSIFPNQNITAGIVNGAGRVTTPSTTLLTIPTTASKLANLKQADRLLIKAYFVTLPATQLLQMYEDYYLKLKLIGDIRYNIEI